MISSSRNSIHPYQGVGEFDVQEAEQFLQITVTFTTILIGGRRVRLLNSIIIAPDPRGDLGC